MKPPTRPTMGTPGTLKIRPLECLLLLRLRNLGGLVLHLREKQDRFGSIGMFTAASRKVRSFIPSCSKREDAGSPFRLVPNCRAPACTCQACLPHWKHLQHYGQLNHQTLFVLLAFRGCQGVQSLLRLPHPTCMALRGCRSRKPS